MSEQEIYLERYDWAVHVLYDVRSGDAMYVRRCLRDLGCKGVPLEDASNLVLEGEANKGLTYSNISKHETVVAIGWTTSTGEYANSLSHEMLHVVQHISEYYLIDMYGEEACYLMGGLMQASTRKGCSQVEHPLSYTHWLLLIAIWSFIHQSMLIYNPLYEILPSENVAITS